MPFTSLRLLFRSSTVIKVASDIGKANLRKN